MFPCFVFTPKGSKQKEENAGCCCVCCVTICGEMVACGPCTLGGQNPFLLGPSDIAVGVVVDSVRGSVICDADDDTGAVSVVGGDV